ncbi:hypothetical protein [Marinoscillum pacificum]|uniref:hypothetical protein n=1 Tax=Marinoscillum pacificum TaxID=392723 RepID=UPI0021585746|nr:hypothetical protein [Marinoscillum pacificum]
MKKCRLISTIQLLSLIPSPLYLVNFQAQDEPSTDNEEMETITLKQRLHTIKMSIKMKMTSDQREEIKSIKVRLQRIGGGLYLSIGSTIVLIILFIMLFVNKYF